MENMKKMSLFLNPAKLVRFQRTNQAWINPVYDASLPCFHHQGMRLGQPGKPSPKTLKQFTLAFPAPRTIVPILNPFGMPHRFGPSYGVPYDPRKSGYERSESAFPTWRLFFSNAKRSLEVIFQFCLGL